MNGNAKLFPLGKERMKLILYCIAVFYKRTIQTSSDKQ